MHRTLTAALALTLVAPAGIAAEQSNADTVAIGPWQVEAAYKGQKFDRCVMSRETEDGVTVRFARDADGLDLSMSSPRWKLGRNKSYPVELAAGSSVLRADVAASGGAVSVPIKDDRFLKSLKLADSLDVKGEGSTIQVALDKSAAGLERLESCYTKNASSTEINPFVAPNKKP